MTSFVDYSNGTDETRVSRYIQEDIIKHLACRCSPSAASGGYWINDFTNYNAVWSLYTARYNIHKNIPSSEKIYDLIDAWGNIEHRMWVHYKRL